MFQSLQVAPATAGRAKQSAMTLAYARECIEAEFPYAVNVVLDRAPIQGVSLWTVEIEDMEPFTVSYSTRSQRVTVK